mmetsp:Transcript_6503/g.13574  ORF Transcript_6503/g.13574 Transcript_6503/m.13574 type:complete len:84 (-) Transcript_6503:424-675(-)
MEMRHSPQELLVIIRITIVAAFYASKPDQVKIDLMMTLRQHELTDDTKNTFCHTFQWLPSHYAPPRIDEANERIEIGNLEVSG